MELKYNLDNIKKVNIDDVRPNSWNPKEKNHAKINDIKESIKLMGFKSPIQVRQNDGYEILDGEQRWTAMKELGAKEIYIYDNGIVSDKDAKSETLWWQVQIPFDEIKLAPIVLELDDLGQKLPFSEAEIQDYKDMAGFDFDQYNNERPEFDDDGVKTLNIKMNAQAYEIVMQAIDKAKDIDPDNISEARAIELICADYIGG